MKLLLFILLSCPCMAQLRSLQNDDRFLHATYSSLITGTVAGYSHFRGMKKHHAIMAGIAASMVIGTAKELLVDEKPSVSDFKYNMLGTSVVAFTFAMPVERVFRRTITERRYRKRTDEIESH